jgi:2-keto-4-pentenoate hydratase/2-oxohepta-3-ene-1,7-dioic acid hydratase in catechol pathway
MMSRPTGWLGLKQGFAGMEIIHYEVDGRERYGEVVGDIIWEWKSGLFDSPERTGTQHARAGVRTLPPTSPKTFVLVSINYEQALTTHNLPRPKNPILFLKSTSAIIPDGAGIRYPNVSHYVTFEPELVLVIGQQCRRVSPEKAMDYVFGYTLTNDLSARDIQKDEGQYTRCKSFDTFGPLGPTIVTGIDASDLRITGYINGEKKTDRRTSSLIFDIPTIVSFTSLCMTLQPGDLISTGAGGVSEIKVGDKVTVAVEKVGQLTNPVIGWDD